MENQSIPIPLLFLRVITIVFILLAVQGLIKNEVVFDKDVGVSY